VAHTGRGAENAGVAREWAVVLDMSSRSAARSFGRGLRDENLDVDIEWARIWCFADTEEGAIAARDLVLRLAERASERSLQVLPMVRRWSEERHQYVDPEAPNEDPDMRDVWIESAIAPEKVTWQVRLTLESVFDFRRVRRQLPRLQRPVIATGNRHIDLGVVDRIDADDIASRALTLGGVRRAQSTEIRGRLRRWLVRQRLASNYAVDSDGSSPGYGYADFGGGGDGGGGGGGGHGGGGHGGH
jgi:hypothetical protein